jgi:hypothetical protein
MNKEIKIGSVWQNNCYSYKAEITATTEKSVIYFNNSELKEFLWSKKGFLEFFTLSLSLEIVKWSKRSSLISCR